MTSHRGGGGGVGQAASAAGGQPLEKSSSADFGKYSHHLGRAEFGTLRRRGISESGAGGSRDGRNSPFTFVRARTHQSCCKIMIFDL